MPAIAALTTIAAARLLSIDPPARPDSGSPLARILKAQSALPPDAVRALQDLRLVAGVQASFFTAQGRYGSVQELKKASYLDPLWPRADRRVYSVSCSTAIEAFVCYADALPPGALYFRVDATQAVRYARGRRPEPTGPVFGIPQEVP